MAVDDMVDVGSVHIMLIDLGDGLIVLDLGDEVMVGLGEAVVLELCDVLVDALDDEVVSGLSDVAESEMAEVEVVLTVTGIFGNGLRLDEENEGLPPRIVAARLL